MVDITFKYVKFIELQLSHSYYEDEIAKTLKVIPFPETERFFNTYNVISKDIGSGIGVFTDKYNSIPFTEVLKADQTLSFNFILRITDKNFFQVTNLSRKTKENILFFTNKGKKISTKEIVTDDDYAAFDNKKILFPGHSPNNLSNNDIGIISINLDKSLVKNILNIFTSEKDIEPPLFHLRFESPKSLWKYIFVPGRKDDKYFLEIKSLKSKVAFQSPKKNTSEFPHTFISKEPIPVTERNGMKLELWNYKSKTDKTKGKIINPYLPVPRKVSYYSKELKNLVSEIYISI